VLTQGNSHYRPNFRIAVIELFPTGRYQNLNPNAYATDATGSGSYQTSIGLNFDLLTQFKGTSHYLKASGSITATLPSTTKVQGLSIYGGDAKTNGYINPGSSIALDLAAEYTLTQNWVAVIETNLLAQKASDFTGNIGDNIASFKAFIKNSTRAEKMASNHIRPSRHNIFYGDTVGSGNMYLLVLAPALEYNISDSLGLTAGVVVSLEGRNSPYFFDAMLEVNYGW
jgi:hypothetical protein